MLVRSVRPTLYLLWGGAVFVLLIGGVNIANLALARSNLRMKELATRLAIGAARAQVAQQLIIESLLLAVAGGLAGMLTGSGILRALRTIGLDRLPRAGEIHMDLTVVGAAMAVSVIVGVLIGLVPVVHLFNVNLSTVLHEESRTGTGGRKAGIRSISSDRRSSSRLVQPVASRMNPMLSAKLSASSMAWGNSLSFTGSSLRSPSLLCC